jgi:predicted GNAT family N-acyltransferase
MEIVYHIKPFAELSVGELHAAASLRERVFYLEQHVTTLDADEKDPFSLFLCERAHAVRGIRTDQRLAVNIKDA